ncbi:twin-arginine translocation signal domain-containing protein [Halobiforma nitratireducens]|nr:twin-arginine translocation signal domain-containing protein [Halobiforma nitratireducens]
MSDDNHERFSMDRRTLLKRTSAASAVALLGATGGAVATDDLQKGVVNKITLDTAEYDDLKEASVVFLRRNKREIVRTKIHSAHEVNPERAAGDANPTKVSYSLSYDESGGVEVTESQDVARLTNGDFTLDRTETTATLANHFRDNSLHQNNDAEINIPDEPELGNLGDAATWVQTESSECGPLARTNLAVEYTPTSGDFDIDDSIGIFETADGETCDGEEFGDRFPCSDLPPGIDCDIPDAFNTTWHVDSSDYSLTSAEGDYYNNDFPIIPESTADHSQDTWFDENELNVEGTVDHSGTFGFRTIIDFLLGSDAGVIFY